MLGNMRFDVALMVAPPQDTLNAALVQSRTETLTQLAVDSSLCGQTVAVVVPAADSSETLSTLRQLLLRCASSRTGENAAIVKISAVCNDRQMKSLPGRDSFSLFSAVYFEL